MSMVSGGCFGGGKKAKKKKEKKAKKASQVPLSQETTRVGSALLRAWGLWGAAWS